MGVDLNPKNTNIFKNHPSLLTLQTELLILLCEKGLAVFCMRGWRQWPDWWQPRSISFCFPEGPVSPIDLQRSVLHTGCSINQQRCSSRPNSLTNTHCISCTVIFSQAALTKNTAMIGVERCLKFDVSVIHLTDGSAAKVVHKLYKLLSAGGHRMSSALSAINGRLGSSGAECVNESLGCGMLAARWVEKWCSYARRAWWLMLAVINTDCGYEPPLAVWISRTNEPQ